MRGSPISRPVTARCRCASIRPAAGARRCARLQSNGVELVGPVGELVSKGGGMHSKVLCFRDPDGTVLEYAEINV